jgi:hypothetical protein
MEVAPSGVGWVDALDTAGVIGAGAVEGVGVFAPALLGIGAIAAVALGMLGSGVDWGLLTAAALNEVGGADLTVLVFELAVLLKVTAGA